MKKTGLRGKVIIGVFIFALFIIVLSSLTIGFNYYAKKMKDYKKQVYSYLKSAAEFIDGDRIASYLGDGEPDEYYDEILKYLETTRRDTDIQLYAVFVPYEDNLEYVWLTADGEDSYAWLHTFEEYMEGGKETRDEVFRKDPIESIKWYDYEGNGIVAGFYPIFDSAGEPVALVDVDLSVPNVVNTIIGFVATLIGGVFAVAAIAGLLYYIYLSKNLINPISMLNTATKRMVENLQSEEIEVIDIHTGDELEELAESFGQMDKDIRRYIKENAAITADRERIDAELSLGKSIQANSLPTVFPPFPERTEFDIYASMNPAKEVGGDFYDFYMLDNDHLVLAIADVSGKGIPAALFMMVSMVLIKNTAEIGKAVSPALVLEYVNNTICRNNDNNMFVTVWLGILTISTRKMICSSAGHEYPVLKKPDGPFEIVKDKHKAAVGTIEGIKYLDYEIDMPARSTLFVYTDGVPEATNASDELYGMERLTQCLNRTPDATPEELLKNVRKSVDEFVGGAPQFDDLTMLAIKMK